MLLRPFTRYIGKQNLKNRLSVFHVHFDAYDSSGNRVSMAERFPLHRELYDFLFLRQLLFKLLDACSKDRMAEASHWMQVILDEIKNQDIQNTLQISHPMITKIQGICTEIQQSPGKSFHLKDLAQRYGYSPDYFGRLFKKISGAALSDYLIRVRINQARIYLKSTDMTIESIAALLGYEDTGFFCRQFKSRMGCSPGQYRRNPST